MNPAALLTLLLRQHEAAVEAEFKRIVTAGDKLDDCIRYLRQSLDEIYTARQFLKEHDK